MRSSRYRRERGVTAVIVAIVIAVLCAFVALVINSGHIMSVRGQLQNATSTVESWGPLNALLTARNLPRIERIVP